MVELSILAWIQMESRPKTVEQVRISHVEIPTFPEQLYKCNFLAFMLVSHSVRYIPGWYVSRHNHSTMKNQRWTEMCCVWSKAWRSIDLKRFFVSVCVWMCTSAPSLAHAGFLGLGHPVIFRRHGNGSVITWNDQSAVRESAEGRGGLVLSQESWETSWETLGRGTRGGREDVCVWVSGTGDTLGTEIKCMKRVKGA